MTAETIASSLRILLPRLWSFAFRLSGTSGLAENLTGRTLIRLAGLADISSNERITPALALREMYAAWKCDLGGTCFQACEQESLPDVANVDADHKELVNAVLSLSGLERAVVLLVHLEQLSLWDIASITNEPVSRVLNALSMAHFKVSRYVNARRRGDRRRDRNHHVRPSVLGEIEDALSNGLRPSELANREKDGSIR
ncbi:RNA polymerase sigma factor [Paraburkholderia rhizosphaerae]|uniref:RNA polymerase sigma-70 factor (ECF subfamily) n=1 Tax=Paraburkholderia rhizosphaerae TaxID=480658 RepID=A0A4R8L5B1_9BURK|nr:hypothetical protein [Paraburkholderia rhizosphaerae]TDY37822.1 RNA polymerase sigma-70 factor (ECF subfamily) [Paraburkholderia rhizosphaerae]